MVKLEHQRITLAAVDACLGRHVAPHSLFQRAPSHTHVGHVAADIRLAISRVVLAPVCGHARLALPMSPPGGLVLERERLSVFLFAASRTGGHEPSSPRWKRMVWRANHPRPRMEAEAHNAAD